MVGGSKMSQEILVALLSTFRHGPPCPRAAIKVIPRCSGQWTWLTISELRDEAEVGLLKPTLVRWGGDQHRARQWPPQRSKI